MSTEENKLLVRRYTEEVVNTGDVSHLPEFIAPEYVETYRNVRYPVGLEGARKHVLGVRETYPDLHVRIDQQIAEGEWVVSVITARGTHSGTWLGMQPSGKIIEITGVNIDRVVGGRIVEHGGAANLLEPFLEIGTLRVVTGEPPAAPDRNPQFPNTE
jgi:predicted ester cyclase